MPTPPRPRPSWWTSWSATSAGRPVTDLTKDGLRGLRGRRPPDASARFPWSSRASGIGIQVRRRRPARPRCRRRSLAESRHAPEADERPPTTAMVFDSLTPEALSLAQTAALAEMPMNGSVAGPPRRVQRPSPACGCCSPTPRTSRSCGRPSAACRPPARSREEAERPAARADQRAAPATRRVVGRRRRRPAGRIRPSATTTRRRPRPSSRRRWPTWRCG